MCDSDKDEFKNHVRKHVKSAPKKCVICDEGGSNSFDLRYHVQAHVSLFRMGIRNGFLS